MNRRIIRHGLFAGLAATVMTGCEGGGGGAPAPTPGPPPAPPADAQKLFQKPAKMPSAKGKAFHPASPPDRCHSGPLRV